jgi:hypothetical protein
MSTSPRKPLTPLEEERQKVRRLFKRMGKTVEVIRWTFATPAELQPVLYPLGDDWPPDIGALTEQGDMHGGAFAHRLASFRRTQPSAAGGLCGRCSSRGVMPAGRQQHNCSAF